VIRHQGSVEKALKKRKVISPYSFSPCPLPLVKMRNDVPKTNETPYPPTPN
jgi:hypothetical protein